MTDPPCPICKDGVLLEWRAGFYCSNCYAENKRDRCDFEGGLCDTPADFQRQVERYRTKRRAKQRARHQVLREWLTAVRDA